MAAAATPTSGDVTSPQPIAEQSEFSGLISRAKEGLSSSTSRSFHHRPEVTSEQQRHLAVTEKSETQTQWDEIEKNMARALKV